MHKNTPQHGKTQQALASTYSNHIPGTTVVGLYPASKLASTAAYDKHMENWERKTHPLDILISSLSTVNAQQHAECQRTAATEADSDGCGSLCLSPC